MKSYKDKETKQDKTIKNIVKIFMGVLLVLMFYNFIVLFNAHNRINKLIKVGKELGLNESNGDYLVDCGDGNYDIYNNKSKKLLLCNGTRQINNAKVYKNQNQLNIYE